MSQENTGTNVPGEDEGGHSLSPQTQEEHAQVSARKKGWKPEDEYKGDPGEWVDAKEFLGREKLYSTIHDLKRSQQKQQVKFEQDMQQMSKHFVEMQEIAYTKAIKDLKAQRKVAIEESDSAAVENIEKEIGENEKAIAKARQAAPKTVTPIETEVFVEWKKENPWFDKNQEMQEDATAIGVGYIARHQGKKDQEEVLEYVKRKIQKMYPDAFESNDDNGEEDEPVRRKPAAKVDNGGTNSRSSSVNKKGKLTVHDLNEQEKSVMETFIKRGALKDIAKKNNRSEQQEYLAQLAQAKGL